MIAGGSPARRLALAGLLLAVPAAAQTEAQVLVQAEAQTLTPSCAGRDVRIEGNHNVVKLQGACRSLLLKGVANQVSLELGGNASIRVEGSENRVEYRGAGTPGIEAFGPDNAVTRGTQQASNLAPPSHLPVPATTTAPANNTAEPRMPAPSSPAAPASPVAKSSPVSASSLATPASEPGPPVVSSMLDLAGDDQSEALDCTGRDVKIAGARALYLLRGGCRSITVRGELITVQAEMAPNAAIKVTGHGDRVGWALLGHGRSPVQTIHGEASHIERLDEVGGTSEHR